MEIFTSPYLQDVNISSENLLRERETTLEKFETIPLDIIYHNVCMIQPSKLQKYLFLEQINGGGSSKIFKGMQRNNETIIVLKELKTQIRKRIFREINILNILKDHKNIIDLHGYFHKKENHYLVFPYIEPIHTRTILHHFCDTKVKKFMKALLETLVYIHNEKIIHRDIKPGNILFYSNEPDDFQVIDFGISDFYIPYRAYNPSNGTKNFKAPEQLLGYKYLDYGIDIWACGIILLEGLSKKIPLFMVKNNDSEISESSMIEKIIMLIGYKDFKEFVTSHKLAFPSDFELRSDIENTDGFSLARYSNFVNETHFKELSKNALDLVTKMLAPNPKKRITAKNALEHPFFTE
jgi:serine/threonine protein kinase